MRLHPQLPAVSFICLLQPSEVYEKLSKPKRSGILPNVDYIRITADWSGPGRGMFFAF
jgi:hypothetical protein